MEREKKRKKLAVCLRDGREIEDSDGDTIHTYICTRCIRCTQNMHLDECSILTHEQKFIQVCITRTEQLVDNRILCILILVEAQHAAAEACALDVLRVNGGNFREPAPGDPFLLQSLRV
jgi:hypothetical protein